MKKRLMGLPLPAVAVLLCSILSACLKDRVETTERYKIYSPVYENLADVRSNMLTIAPRDIQYPGKIYIKGNYLFISEVNRGIHIIDNSLPSAPKNIGFLKIPYNVDMAIKNNTLYADMGADLLSFDIQNPQQGKLRTITEKAFPNQQRWATETDKVLVDWSVRDTIVHSKADAKPKENDKWIAVTDLAYNTSSGNANSVPNAVYGTGGSMARFTAFKDRLFTVGVNNLGVFNIKDDFKPVFVTRKDLGWGIETIFPFQDNLFIGSIAGVKIFSTANPDEPTLTGEFGHVRKCDPVVTNGKNIFVTLRAGSNCGGGASELQILTATPLTSPSLVKSYTLENPFGLAVDGNTLLVCDGWSGLKVYDISDVQALKQIAHIKDIVPFDVIAGNGLAIVSAIDGIYQYDYKSPSSPKLLSSIKLKK